MTNFPRRTALVAAATVVALSPLAACSKIDTAAEKTAATTAAATGPAVTMTDQWVKAAPSGMTGMFGTLTNSGKTDATMVSASSPSAGKVELHEVVTDGGASTMRPKASGFTIPAGGSHVLAPGADHIMLMDLTGPLAVGSSVEVTLTFADGSTVPVSAEVRDFSGAAESYQPSAAPEGHAGHNG